MNIDRHKEMTDEVSIEDSCASSIVEVAPSSCQHDLASGASANTTFRRYAAETISSPEKPNETLSSTSDDDTELISAWISFTDDDTTSSASSDSSWATYKYNDLTYSMTSNLFFLVGACIQTYTSLIELKDTQAEWMEDDDGASDDDYVLTAGDKVWYVLYSLAPFLYVINACFDVRWAIENLTLSSLWSWVSRNNDVPSHELQQEGERMQQNYEHIQAVEESGRVDTRNDDEYEYDANSFSSEESSSVASNYVSKTLGHLVVAMIFGVGAILECYSTFLDDNYEEEDDWDDDSYLIKVEEKRSWFVNNYKINFIGMHLYLLSGLIQLVVQRNSYRSGCQVGCCGRRFSCNPHGDDTSNESRFSSDRVAQYLMFVGTVLFLCGTLLDCTIAYLSDPEIRHDIDPSKKVLWDLNELTLSICDLISSVLWNIDAVLYIMADALLYNLHRKDSKGRKWLCEKRIPFQRSEDATDDSHPGDWNQTSVPLLPTLEGTNSSRKNPNQPLLGNLDGPLYSSI